MTRWQQVPAVPDHDARAMLAEIVRRARLHVMRGERDRELDELARASGVSLRTLQRYAKDSYQCVGFPLGSCLTRVRGGGLCSYCRKTRAA